MSGTNATVARGKIIAEADKNLDKPNQSLLDGLLAAARLSDRAIAVGVMKESDKQHVDDDWFGPKWWGDIPAAERETIVREGYIKALEVSRDAGWKPIVSHWVAGGSQFEVMVSQSDYQVSLFIVTPQHPKVALPDANKADTERLWLVAPEARVVEVRKTYPDSYNMGELTKDTYSAGIKCLQLKGY